MPLRPLGAPLWFHLALVVGWSVLVRALDRDGAGAGDVQLAFWGFLIAIGAAIWEGLQTVASVTVQFLAWAVDALWIFARSTYNGLIGLGRDVLTGFNKAWGFLKGLYDHVLKPAWSKFWKIVDAVRGTLERIFGPVLRVLRAIRTWILDFYRDYVQPILDTIDLVQRGLRLLKAVGVEWAATLDDYLTQLEEKIQAPFTFLLRKLNEVINIVNRVVTADGLFQRLALIRSIERDIRYVVHAWHNSQSKPLTKEDRDAALARDDYKSGAQIMAESRAYIETGEGPHAASISEMSLELALRLRAG